MTIKTNDPLSVCPLDTPPTFDPIPLGDELADVRGGHGDVALPMGSDLPSAQRALNTAGNIAVAAGLAGVGALLGPAQQLKWKVLGYPGK